MNEKYFSLRQYEDLLDGGDISNESENETGDANILPTCNKVAGHQYSFGSCREDEKESNIILSFMMAVTRIKVRFD